MPLKKQCINFANATIHSMIQHLREKTAIKVTTSQKFKKAVGSKNKHNGLFHRPRQVSNLPCQPRHCNNHQGNDDGGGHKNVGEQDVHHGQNGCMGEQDHCSTNLAESPGLLQRKMARAKIILASHHETFAVQGCSPCSPRASSSRGRRQDHQDDALHVEAMYLRGNSIFPCG